MTTIQTTDVHRVVGITVEPVVFPDFVSHRISLELEGDNVVEVSAFSYSGLLEIKQLPPRFSGSRAETKPSSALLDFAREFLADYESEGGMLSMKHYADKARAAIRKAEGEA